MLTTRLLLPWIAILVLVASALVACGASHDPSVRLVSVTVSPATASGEAQFTATGFYSDGSKVTPLPALWFRQVAWNMEANPVNWSSLFNVDEATGKASCIANSGTFSVVATAPVDPHFLLSQMTPSTPQVSGSAQLTCP